MKDTGLCAWWGNPSCPRSVVSVFNVHIRIGRSMWLLLTGAGVVVAACFFVARATVRAVADIASGTDTLG